MYEERCNDAARRILGEEVVVMRRGFVDTTRGLVLSTDAALAAARSQAKTWRGKQGAAARKEAAKCRAEPGLVEQPKTGVRAVRARRGGPSKVAELADEKAQEELAAERLGAAESMLALGKSV